MDTAELLQSCPTFWNRNRDALISWVLNVHHETPRPCYPCFATFFQLANNMNCEASMAATNATASFACGSVAPAVLNRQLASFPSKRLKIIPSMSPIVRVASKLIFSFLGNAQSVASRNVWNGVSSELNAFHRNLLTTQVALQVELDFAHNVVKRPKKKYSEVPEAGDAHLPSISTKLLCQTPVVFDASCQRQYHRYICYNKSVISTMQICDMMQDHSRFF